MFRTPDIGETLRDKYCVISVNCRNVGFYYSINIQSRFCVSLSRQPPKNERDEMPIITTVARFTPIAATATFYRDN